MRSQPATSRSGLGLDFINIKSSNQLLRFFCEKKNLIFQKYEGGGVVRLKEREKLVLNASWQVSNRWVNIFCTVLGNTVNPGIRL